MQTNIVIIACSIFKNELEYLKDQEKINVPVVYLNSMLHMQPNDLQVLLDSKIEEYNTYKIILVFGDCHARIDDYKKHSNIQRTKGINCCEILLGTDKYKEIRKEGAFILLPEWADRWKEVFIDYLGFKNEKTVKEFMREMHKKLVFIDTKLQKINGSQLKQISDFLGLPLEMYYSSVNEIEKAILCLLEKND
jgi:hypothetical protein